MIINLFTVPKRFSLLCARQVVDLYAAYPCDGSAQTDQIIPVKLIGPAKAVNDMGYRFFILGMPLIVGELEVFDNRAVFVFSFGSSQIHDCLH